MGPVIADILPLALGIALSVIPIVAVILMLFSQHARSTSLGFLVGLDPGGDRRDGCGGLSVRFTAAGHRQLRIGHVRDRASYPGHLIDPGSLPQLEETPQTW